MIHFGGTYPQYYKGDLSFTKSDSRFGLWEIPIDDFGLGKESFGYKGRTGIIDTGTSLILIPNNDAIPLHQKIPGARTNGESFAVPCTTNSSLFITFSGVEYEIPPTDWVGEVINNALDLCLSGIVGRVSITVPTTLGLLANMP